VCGFADAGADFQEPETFRCGCSRRQYRA
jgi:hypothetical protein